MQKKLVSCALAFVLAMSLIGGFPLIALADELDQIDVTEPVNDNATSEDLEFEAPPVTEDDDVKDTTIPEPTLSDVSEISKDERSLGVEDIEASIITPPTTASSINALGTSGGGHDVAYRLLKIESGKTLDELPASSAANNFLTPAKVSVQDGKYLVDITATNAMVVSVGIGQADASGNLNGQLLSQDGANTTYRLTLDSLITTDINDVVTLGMKINTGTAYGTMTNYCYIVFDQGDVAKIGGGGEEGDGDGDGDGNPQPVNKTALLALIQSASAKNLSDYNAASFNNLQRAIEAAKVIANKPDATQLEVTAQIALLQTAINNLVPAQTGNTELPPTTNAFGLEDGKYQVTVNLWHATQNQESMGNGSLNHTALLEVINGNMYLSISIHPMQVGDIVTSLTGLQIRQPNGAYYSASVIAYNLAGGKPSAYRFAIYNLDSYLAVKMDSPVTMMGTALLDARLLINWSSLTRVSDNAVLSSNTQTYYSSFSIGEASGEESSIASVLADLAVQSAKSASSNNASTIIDQTTPTTGTPAAGFPYLLVSAGVVAAAAIATGAVVGVKTSAAKKLAKLNK